MRVILVGLFVQVHFGIDSQILSSVSDDKDVLLLVQGKKLSHGKFYGQLLDRKGERAESCSCICCFLAACTSSNQYARLAYFRVACSESLPVLTWLQKGIVFLKYLSTLLYWKVNEKPSVLWKLLRGTIKTRTGSNLALVLAGVCNI